LISTDFTAKFAVLGFIIGFVRRLPLYPEKHFIGEMASFRYWLSMLLLVFVTVGCGQESGVIVESLEQPDTASAAAPVPLKERRLAIVYSENSAANYFDEFAFGQLYTAMQHQAMQSGMPYDLLTEADLENANNLLEYDALIIPLLSHVDRDSRDQILNALLTAQNNGTAIITASEFLTYDQNNQPFANAYSGMIDILGLTPKSYLVGEQTTLKIANNTHPITNIYKPNEVLGEYPQSWFAEFSPVDSAQAATLVTGTVGSKNHVVVQALDRAGRVVHFANDAFMADKNLLFSAIRWAVYGDEQKRYGPGDGCRCIA